MGYFEVPCLLCGVSPKIGRRRTPSEPREAAWSIYSYEPAVMDDGYCFRPGCKLSEREPESEGKPAAVRTTETLYDVLPFGTDQGGNEISFEAYMTSKLPLDVELRQKCLEDTYDGRSSRLVNEYRDWYHIKMQEEKRQKKHDESFFEHLAGPHCIEYHSYNGHAISAEEMKYCTTMQFIVPCEDDYHQSDPNQSPEPDDEEFERKGEYHLTGLGDRCGSYEDDCSIYPARHGCDEVNPMDIEGFDDGAPPFHPYCLEVYRRVSGLRRGTTDLLDLAHWYERQGAAKPNHPAVDRGRDQWWFHRAGDEFLVANPLHIPGLAALLEAAKRPQADFDARASPFGAKAAISTVSGDLFGKLPQELRDLIVAPLGSRDIASLRLASRSFRHLPCTLWHDLMEKEMPWIWEAWSDRPYPLMACTTKNEFIKHDESIQDRLTRAAELQGQQKVIQEQIIAQDNAQFRKPRHVQRLDRLHTDWYYLYCQIRREWKNIKGLQNRERIWKVVEFVSRRIVNPSEDFDVAKEEHANAFPYKDLNPDD